MITDQQIEDLFGEIKELFSENGLKTKEDFDRLAFGFDKDLAVDRAVKFANDYKETKFICKLFFIVGDWSQTNDLIDMVVETFSESISSRAEVVVDLENKKVWISSLSSTLNGLVLYE